MQWSANQAMLQMWSEMDQSVSSGEMMRFFQRHLQAAYDAGRRDAEQEDFVAFDALTGRNRGS